MPGVTGSATEPRRGTTKSVGALSYRLSVRILHTSDWHLGRSFHGVGMVDAQAAFVDHLLETVVTEDVDLVLVAGDVYDRALPPVDAVELASEAFARLSAAGVRTVVTSGNHDSAIRLGSNARLVDAAGVHLRTRWQEVGTPVLLEDRHGPVAVYGLPYLEPDAVRQAWELPARTHEAALAAATQRVTADLEQRGAPRSVVMAHAFVAGSPEAAATMGCDSERDISVGGLQIAPTSLFTPFSYAALGHLHGASSLTDSVRYSGSPLAYSFSEAGHAKGSWLVELGREGAERADFVAAPVVRPLSRLRGRLEELLHDPTLTTLEGHWVAATLTDPHTPRQAMERLRSRFPHALTLAFEPEGGVRGRSPVMPHLSGRSDFDIALGFVEEVRSLEATTEEALLLQLACDSCRINGDPQADGPLEVPALEDVV
jgi:exonuclease SbcD